MPATTARATFIRSEFRRVIANTPEMQTRYGNLARITDDPLETFFDSAADAQLVAYARQSLLGAERRRFKPVVNDITDALALTFSGVAPLATYVDAERSVASGRMIISDMVIDLERESATFTLWGGTQSAAITADTTLVTADTTHLTADNGA